MFLVWACAGLQGASVKPALVRGRVLAADTGAPVKRAQVVLRLNSAGNTTSSATTDANGFYEIRNLDPGMYTATAGKSGFITASWKPVSPGSGFKPLVLAEDQEAKDIDFLLPRAGVLAGTVLDERDEPIPGVNVQAMMKTYNQAGMQLQVRGGATTDDRGHYRIHDLPAGRYYVQAFRSNNQQPAPHYSTVLFPGASRLAEAQVVKLAASEEVSGLKLQMRESPVFTVSGTVIDIGAGVAATGA